MQKKYQIFISSPFRDLVDERQDAIRAVLQLGHIPAGMELFPASDIDQFKYIKQIIDECDYYVVIIGGKYGTIDGEGISFTEREYDYAVRKRKFVIALIHGDLQSIPLKHSETHPPLIKRLMELRAKLSKGRVVKYWTTRDELDKHLFQSIIHATVRHPKQGWIRGTIVMKENISAQIASLRSENAKLRTRNRQLERALMPTLLDDSELDEMFTFRFECMDLSSGQERTVHQNLSMAWRDIFSVVGPAFSKPARSDVIAYVLERYVYDRKDVPSHPSILDVDVVTVKTQLITIGLLKSYVPRSSNTISEFLELTSAGRSKLKEAQP